MAIAFARARYVSRSSGGNAVRSSAYIARTAIEAERTGEVFHFRHRDAPEHHAVLLPNGADPRFTDCALLWNAAEAAERRKDSQVAREIVLALPADRDVTGEDRVTLAQSFAQEHFVDKGLAVQLDVHAPHDAAEAGERANWHAHLLVTTRRLGPDGLSPTKARDLDPEVRSAAGRARVADGAAWGELWRAHQDRYFQEHGIAAQVDAAAPHAQEHIGPVRMRRAGSAVLERAETIRDANQEAARDPAQVLAALTRNNATFTPRDLDRFLLKQLPDETEAGREAIRAAVLSSPELVVLCDRETGAPCGRFTTREVRAQEQSALADGAAVAGARHHGGVKARHQEAALAGRTLRDDQRAAFEHAAGAGGLKLIEGRAGTGKSYTLAAVRDAHERDGKRVVGLAPTNAVAQDLKADGFRDAGTVHAALFALKNGRDRWDRRTVVVVDEAAMLDTRVTGELLAAAHQSGAKVILAGDDRQLASIERGGLFAELRGRHGAAEISEVTRQRVDWQRQAARDLAEGRFGEAVGAFDRAGAITWTATQEEARHALVQAWTRDGEAQPGQSRFVFAYTNRDVDALNAELRAVRRERGELSSADTVLATKHGEAAFAVGDRVQFTDTDKRARIYNGNVGTITRLDPKTGEITAKLDAVGQPGREVSWSADSFEGFRHGYAGTIYKGQGKTLDRTYLYHTEHWRSAASYVALTRQRESAAVFVARETAGDAPELARQMGRGEVRAASVAWATRDELGAELANAKAKEQAAQFRQTTTPKLAEAPAPFLAAWRDPTGQGRDSLGRGLDAGSLAGVVAADARVRREQVSHGHYLQGAYRDPVAAGAALRERVKQDGSAEAAKAVVRDPGQFGELLGKEGWFASAAAKAERVRAGRMGGALADSLRRMEAAEAAARDGYVRQVTEQQGRDAVEVPGLSRAALDTLAAVRAARRAADPWREGEGYADRLRRAEQTIAAAWQQGRADPRVAAELDRFMEAAGRRLGEEGARDALRANSGGRPAQPIPPELEALAQGYVAGHDGKTYTGLWQRRVSQQQRDAARARARADDPQTQGLSKHSEHEQQTQTRGLRR